MSAARIVGIAVVIVALVPGFAAGASAKKASSGLAPVAAPPVAASAPAGGTIGSFDQVTAGQITATASTDIKAALALVPTLVINEVGGPAGRATISLRGSTAEQVLVLVDGRRVSRSPSTAFNLNDLALPVGRVVRIDVIPAPASLIYGADAIGGVVNIITRATGTSPAIGVSYGRGTEDEQRLAGGVQYGFKKLGFSLDGQWLTGDGFRENGGYDLKSFVVGLAVAPAPWGLDARWTSLSRANGDSGSLEHPTPEARREDALDGLSADVLYLSGSGLNLKAGVFSRSQTLRLTDPTPSASDPLVAAVPIDSRQKNSSYGFETQLDFARKDIELYSVGAEWVSDSVAIDGGEDHAAERWALYTQDQWHTGNWSAVGTLRRDEHSVFGGRTNPSLTVGWGSGGWKLWAAWAKNCRTPSYEELYADGQFAKGNPDLKKLETSESYDGGLELAGGWGRVRLSAFNRGVDNMIIWTDADGDLVFRPEYLERATVSGWEAQALYRVSASIAIPVGYQRLSIRDEETGAETPGRREKPLAGGDPGDRHIVHLVARIRRHQPGGCPSGRRVRECHHPQCGARVAGHDCIGPGAGQSAGGESPGPGLRDRGGLPDARPLLVCGGQGRMVARATPSGVSLRALRDFRQAVRGGPFRVALVLSLLAHLVVLAVFGWGGWGREGGADRSPMMHVRLLLQELPPAVVPAAPAIWTAGRPPRREMPGRSTAEFRLPPPASTLPAPGIAAPSAAQEPAPVQPASATAGDELQAQSQSLGIVGESAPLPASGVARTLTEPASGMSGTDSGSSSPVPAAAGSGSGGPAAAGADREGLEAGGAAAAETGPATAAAASTASGHGPGPREIAAVRRRIDAHKVYPPIAVRNGWEGRVLVEMRLEGDGSLTTVRLLEGSGHAVLDDATIVAVRRASPFPPVARVLTVPVEYRLVQ